MAVKDLHSNEKFEFLAVFQCQVPTLHVGLTSHISKFPKNLTNKVTLVVTHIRPGNDGCKRQRRFHDHLPCVFESVVEEYTVVGKETRKQDIAMEECSSMSRNLISFFNGVFITGMLLNEIIERNFWHEGLVGPP